jgi:MtrB/PioB family decaheme-associated outer membrane protein
MRITRTLVLLSSLLAGPALAQTTGAQRPAGQPGAPQPGGGETSLALAPNTRGIDFGLRLNRTNGDPGRFQRFEDLQTGPTLERFRYLRDRDTWAFSASADNVGYQDQHYLASFERFGRIRASFEWTQVPLWYSDETQTPFREEADGVFRLADTVQAGVQNRTSTLNDYAAESQQLEMRSRRDVAAARLRYSAAQQLDLHAAFTSTARTGEQPWSAPFGFLNTTVVPLTLDFRTNELNTTAEWSSPRGMARVAYDGSWFNNGTETLIWDNPLRFTDQTHPQGYLTGDASSHGRMALAPDSTAHTVSASGAVTLPARSRAFAYVSVGRWLQDERLLPHTINTAIAPISLDRETADAEARITSMNYRFTSRPASSLWLNAQYRLYDFDNRTPHFAVDQYVRLDGNVATSVTGGSHAFAYTRHFVDVDASFTPFRWVAFRAGYGRQQDDRTYRYFEETDDHTVRASIDSAGLSWGSVRLQYDRSHRTGDGFDEEALSEIGEQVSLRQFDIANRTRNRVTAIVQVVPFDTIGFNASAAIGEESRPESAFGLQDNDFRAFTVGVDYTPVAGLSAGLSYGFDNYSTLQQSRQANPGPQFADPTHDWWTDMNEDVHTWSLSVAVPQVTSRTSANVGYDFVGSRARYLYIVRPDTTLTQPQQLRPVRNTFHTATADVRHTLTRQLALGVGYRFDGYDVEDFALSPGTLNSPLIPTFLNLMHQSRPYHAHTGFVRLMYTW